MNNWRSNLFLIVELIELLGSEFYSKKHAWNALVITGIGSLKSVFELACIYDWITPWISVLMD